MEKPTQIAETFATLATGVSVIFVVGAVLWSFYVIAHAFIPGS